MLAGFKKFVMRGNIVDLAVAFVVGAAFSAVVTALVESLIMPLVTALFGEPTFNDLKFTINESRFEYGQLLTAVVNFLLIAGALYSLIITPMNAILDRRNREDGQILQEPTETELLKEIKGSSEGKQRDPASLDVTVRYFLATYYAATSNVVVLEGKQALPHHLRLWVKRTAQQSPRRRL